ncbi:hypothetical protein ACHAXN_000423 [Cyclotella atomus]
MERGSPLIWRKEPTKAAPSHPPSLPFHWSLPPIAALLHEHAAARLAYSDPGDDGLCGVSDPMANVVDKYVCIYLHGVLFFLTEFDRVPVPKA